MEFSFPSRLETLSMPMYGRWHVLYDIKTPWYCQILPSNEASYLAGSEHLHGYEGDYASTYTPQRDPITMITIHIPHHHIRLFEQ